MGDNSTRRALLETLHFVPVFYFLAAIVALIRSYALAANRFDDPFFLVLTGIPIALLVIIPSDNAPLALGKDNPRWAQVVSLLLVLVLLFNLIRFGVVQVKYPGQPCTAGDKFGYCNHGLVAEATEAEYMEARSDVQSSVRFLVRSGLAMLAMIYLAAAIHLRQRAEEG